MILGQLVQEERLTGRTLVDPRGEGIHQVRIVAIDLLGLREVLQACALSRKEGKESASGKRIQDPTSGMRLFDSTMIPLFAQELDFGPEPDTISLLMHRGVRVGEVQVEMRERVAGESYLNFTKSMSYMLRICISILFVQWVRGRK